MATQNANTELGVQLQKMLDSCGGDARVVSDAPGKVRITNIPYSATFMLPGGMSTLRVLSEHWGEWDIEYVKNGGTRKFGRVDDKDVVITRTE